MIFNYDQLLESLSNHSVGCWDNTYPDLPFPSIASLIAPGDMGNSFMRLPMAW